MNMQDPDKRRARNARVEEVAASVGADLALAALDLLSKLTEDEACRIEACPVTGKASEYRLAKALIVAVTRQGRVDQQWSAETIEPHVKRLRSISRRRP